MEKVVSLSADLTNLQLQKIFQRTNPAARILACQKLGGTMRNPRYAFVIATPDGDYSVLSVDLIQVGMMASDYTIGSKIMLHERGLQTMYDATRAIENIKHSAVVSHSGPPPLSSIKFSLDDFGIEASPLIDTVLEEWRQTQTIAPIRYAVYNQPRGEIEISLADPSADNDEEHVAELREAIASELHKNFDDVNVAQPDPATARSGRYSRRYENLRNHDMSLIRLTIPGQELVSESAKAPSYKFARVSGKAELVLPSSKRAALTEIKTHLKQAKSDRTKALRVAAQHEKTAAAAEKASTPERKKALKAKAKTLKGQASALNKTAKAALSAANKSARSHGLGGLKMPVNADILASAKKLAAVKTDVFGADGKRGTFKPKFAPDSKFEALGAGKVTAAAQRAPAKTVAPKKGMAGATGGHSAAKEKQARAQGLMGKKPRYQKVPRAGHAERVADMMKGFALEDRAQMKALRSALGTPIKKSDFKKSNYATKKDGSITIVTKDDVRYDISAADMKKHGIDSDHIQDMLETAGARQRAAIVSVGRKGSTK
ncbi:hypothetical protein YOLOSWAG_187 [Erwinia phage vB_EamM_Yoloswag]|uniref:Uncharacterized protein n=1 Tax=Erwinia phage vB_EamM_Yoloswag TaxID=1958956 RepID=A0A1S6L3C1_9CAUD|nr:hypothetical protein HOR66_gp187 [Erwinia phage vB_EamM_Yoloswag]AQT28666.1 hypothetical protein YOLOSWAG_187 [Erwinia phage vB_EamM_Yoloswag]